jgi:threonine dehydrogenase-like Zn-dependent dehydrogenase
VKDLKAGDRVVGALSVFCGACRQCLGGRFALCADTDVKQPPGKAQRLSLGGRPVSQVFNLSGFAEQMLVHRNALVKIREDMPLDRAALLGCAVITGTGAVFRNAQVPAGASVAVVGCGGVGLAAINGALIAGAARIIAVDTVPSKLELARRFGATDVVLASDGDVVAKVVELTQGGVEFAFECIGLPATFEQCFRMLQPGGTVTVLGPVRARHEGCRRRQRVLPREEDPRLGARLGAHPRGHPEAGRAVHAGSAQPRRSGLAQDPARGDQRRLFSDEARRGGTQRRRVRRRRLMNRLVQYTPERLVLANRLTLCYDAFGDADHPPVVLIMGMGAQMIGWDDEFCEQLAAQGFYVVRFDNRDAGRSSRFDDAGVPDIMAAMTRAWLGMPVHAPYLLRDMALDLVGLLDSAEHPARPPCRRVDGRHDRADGGALHPERVLSLTSIMSTTGDRDLPQPKPWALTALMKPAPVALEDYVEHYVRTWRSSAERRSRKRTSTIARVPSATTRGPQSGGRRAAARGDPRFRQPPPSAASRFGPDTRDPRRRRPAGPAGRRDGHRSEHSRRLVAGPQRDGPLVAQAAVAPHRARHRRYRSGCGLTLEGSFAASRQPCRFACST